MNKLLAAAKQPRILIPAIIVIAVVVAVVAIASRPDSKTRQNSLKPNSQGLSSIKKKDNTKKDRMYDMINLIVGTYTDARVTYPPTGTAGWADIVENVPQTESFTDPFTEAFYKYTDDEPDFGEINYKPGVDCDPSTQKFKAGTFRMVALRAKFSDGVKCISSVQVQAAQSKDVR